MAIADEIKSIESQIDGKARLIAVSKLQSDDKILLAYESGFKRFGENYVQELQAKYDRLPKDIEWHMIGHLQSNKVKYIAPFVSMIHSVDSLKLLLEIDKQAAKYNRIIPVLLQIHIAQEETKTGLSESELFEILDYCSKQNHPNILLKGLMGMSTFTEDKNVVKAEFTSLKLLFDKVNSHYPAFSMTELSMGMSDDWQLAVESGSTLIRVGSAIFGKRS